MLLHIVLLWALSHWQQHKPEAPSKEPEPVINAQLLFLPKPKEAEKPKPVETEKPKIAESEKTEELAKPAPQPQQAQNQAQPNQLQAQTPQQQIEAGSSTPTQSEFEHQLPEVKVNATPKAVFNPYRSIDTLLQEQDQKFLDGITMENPPPPQIKSINAYDDPAVKPIFKTESQVSPEVRIVNYNGHCVMLARELDHNGFTRHRWTGYSGNCGQNDDMKKQLKLSLEKFIKKKDLEE